MSAVAIIVLAIALAGAIAAIVSLALSGRTDARRASDERAAANEMATTERVKHADTRGELDRARFELGVAKQDLEHETKRADAFEEALADVAANSDLLPGDVRRRVLVAAIKAKAAAARAAGGHPAGASEGVRAPAAADGAEPAGVPGDGLLRPGDV